VALVAVLTLRGEHSLHAGPVRDAVGVDGAVGGQGERADREHGDRHESGDQADACADQADLR